MKTIAQQLQVKNFPFEIKDKNGHTLYYENCDNDWSRYEYNAKGQEIYFENSNGVWSKSEYVNGNEIYYENSNGFWSKCKRDSHGKEIYFENSNGIIIDNRKWPFSKAIVEVTLEDIAKQMGIKVEQLRIKD